MFRVLDFSTSPSPSLFYQLIFSGLMIGYANVNRAPLDQRRRALSLITALEEIGESNGGEIPVLASTGHTCVVLDQPDYELLRVYLQTAIELPAWPARVSRDAVAAFDWLNCLPTSPKRPAPVS